jgi:hypothetical protein
MEGIDFAEDNSGNVIEKTFPGDMGLMSEIFIGQFDEFAGAICGFSDEKINVPGVSRVAMGNHRVAADGELNAM